MSTDSCSSPKIKRCRKCSDDKPIDEFYKRRNPGRHGSFEARCKSCVRAAVEAWRKANPVRVTKKAKADYRRNRPERIAQAVRWRKANPDRYLDAYLRRNYAMSLVDYEAMLCEQDGKCFICQKEPSGHGRYGRLWPDHDHESKAVRGLLCSRCNSGLAFLGSVQLLRRAVVYLITAPHMEGRKAA